MNAVYATPVVEDSPVARLHEMVDALEIYLELIQDESIDGYAPLAGCRQYLERIRSYSRATIGTDAVSSPLSEMEPWSSQSNSGHAIPLDKLFSAMFLESPDAVACLRGDEIVACNPRCVELCETASIRLETIACDRSDRKDCPFDVARLGVRLQDVAYELLWLRKK